MFLQNSDAHAAAGDNFSAVNSKQTTTELSQSGMSAVLLPLASSAPTDHLAFVDSAADNIEQLMAGLEASKLTISNNSTDLISCFQTLDSITGADTTVAGRLVGNIRESQLEETRSADAIYYNGKDYFLTSGSKTWEDAQAEAQQLGGNLVTINDAAEDAWLRETFGQDEGLWMGLSDKDQEGIFQWASGEAVTYTNWAAGEPNDYQGNQDYGRINFGGRRQWDDEHDSTQLRGIIEVDINAPEPSAPTTPIQSSTPTTPNDNDVTYGDSHYVVVEESLTWEAAQAKAAELGGNLVTINDAAEDQWLQQQFGRDEAFWMGLNDKAQEGTFQWASGEAVTYTNWAPGEPNNWGGDQDYGRINFGGDRQWDDESDNATFKSIVEIKLNGEPSEPEGGEDLGPILPEGEGKGGTPEPVDNSFFYNGSQYVLTQYNTWKGAQAEAQALNGNLVTINDAAEDQWLQQTFGRDQDLWMGLTDRNQEGSFQWVSGEALTYTNWAPGEPNDWQGNQDFGRINFGENRQWDDDQESTIRQGIVEIKFEDEPPVVEPPIVDSPTEPSSATYNGNYYSLSQWGTWEEAEAEAQGLGGHLVAINDAAEERWLQQTFGDDKDLWIGLTDKAQEGNFKWSNGDALTYRNWAPGEPNDWQGNQDFGRMNFGDDRQWDDDQESTIRRGIIEIALKLPDVDGPIKFTDDEDVINIYANSFTRDVPEDYSGYNTNAVEITDWSDVSNIQALARAVDAIGGQTLRIPGGDTANYWDWDLGGVVQWSNEEGEARPTWEYPYFLPESLPLALNWEYGTTASLENMKRLFDETDAEPIWVVNMNTSDLGKEIRHLQEAMALGYSVERIELGNELYFGIQNYVRPDYGGEAPQVGGTPTAKDYAAQAKEWAIALRAVPGLEDATIAVTGVSPIHVPEQRGVEWWPALLEKTGSDNRSAVDVVDAFTLHPYYSTNELGITKSDVGSWNRAGEIARDGIKHLREVLADPALHQAGLENEDVWITEHNIIEDATIVLGGTWLQALMLDIHTQEFLIDDRVTVSTAHLLTGNPQWQGITDQNGLQIDGSQRGTADRPFTNDYSKPYEPTAMGLVLGKTADIFDGGTATLLKHGEGRAFIAWQVENNGTKEISAVNANNASDTLILPEGATWEITTYTNDPWATLYGEASLNPTVQRVSGGETLNIGAFTKVIAKAV